MIRTFCDCCGDEITEANTPSTRTSTSPLGRMQAVLQPRVEGGDTLRVEVITGTDTTWNAGHWCMFCIIDAFTRLDTRPKAAAPAPGCWLVEKRKDGRTVAYLGRQCGAREWVPIPQQATRFARREDASGVADCMETDDVIVAEHFWG